MNVGQTLKKRKLVHIIRIKGRSRGQNLGMSEDLGTEFSKWGPGAKSRMVVGDIVCGLGARPLAPSS